MNAYSKPLFAAVLVATQLGCSLASKQPPSEEVRASLGTVGVMTLAQEPEIQLPDSLTQPAQGRTTAQAIGQSAKAVTGGLIGAVGGALIGGLIGLALCAPVGPAAAICAGAMVIPGATGALVGGVYGTMKASTPEDQAAYVSPAPLGNSVRDSILKQVDSAGLRRSVSDQVVTTARGKTDRNIMMLNEGWDETGTPAKIDTALELKIDTLGLVADQTGTAILAKGYVKTGATLVRVADRRVLYSGDFEYVSATRPAEDWNDESSWREFFAEAAPWLAEATVDQLFVTPPAAPIDWPATVKKPLIAAQESFGSWFSTMLSKVESNPAASEAQSVLEPAEPTN